MEHFTISKYAAATVGGSKWEHNKALEGGTEIVVANPGRMIDFVKMKATNLSRVACLVLDEADRIFEMCFGKQTKGFFFIKKIIEKKYKNVKKKKKDMEVYFLELQVFKPSGKTCHTHL